MAIARNTGRRTATRNSPHAGKSYNRAKLIPFILAFTFLGILFVLIRMRGIEQDYKLNEISKLIKKRTLENKELKADKARLLSIKQLELFASKHGLKEPDENHIIIIPE